MRLDVYGKLTMNDEGEYIIDKINLTKLLNKIYYSNSPTLSIVIDSNTRTLFDEIGELYLDKDDFGIYCWHIDGECLESVLFNNTETMLEIYIDTNVKTGGIIDDIQEFIYNGIGQ